MKNLYQKICDVMLEVSSVEKNATISMGGNSYSAVTHDDVTRLLHGPCAKQGIVLAPSVVQSSSESVTKIDKYGNNKQEQVANVLVRVTAINADNPEERLFVEMPSIAFDSGDKAFGKAISMATKYAYLKLFMLESVDEEESRPDAAYSYQKKQTPSFKMDNLRVAPDSQLVDEVKSFLAEKTKGNTAEQKTKFLAEKFKVAQFNDLLKLTELQLKDRLENARKN